MLGKILSVPERIKLFKEINRVHKEMYGWNMIYDNAWHAGKIDIVNDTRLGLDEPVPISKSDTNKYYFLDDKGKDIPSFKGIFEWQAYYFYHLNPYRFFKVHKNGLTDEDFISDSLGKRIRPDISHPVDCLETMIEVQQRKEDGRIWISSNWLYHYDCYGSGAGLGGLIYETLSEAAGRDEIVAKDLQVKYEEIIDVNRYEFKKALEKYFRGERLNTKYWHGGYLFAASKEWRIKTLEQLNEAQEVETMNFLGKLEEFIGWFRSNGLSLGEKAKEGLRSRIIEFYDTYLCRTAKEWCKLLVEEDKVETSDVYLWWGGEPNSDACYAFLTLFFKVDPEDIGTPRFDMKFSRNLRAIINIAEKERYTLSSHRDYEPQVWNAVFS